MTRGNPRPGQQQMPDRSDETERVAQKIKAATTKAAGEIRKDETPVVEETREAPRKAGKGLDRVRKRATKVSK